ncbi:MAG: secretin N-terminal domain-containing protein, partial [Planctomycetota bacterium]
MDRSKSIISIVVGLAAIFIIWWVGFHPDVPEPSEKSSETKVAADPDKPGEAAKPTDPNKPGRPVVAKGPEKPKDPNAPGKEVAKGDEKKAEDPNDPMESLNLNNVAMKDIIKKLADWTGKAIICSDDAQKEKVSVYAPKKVRRSEALSLIYASLRMKGYAAEPTDKIIYIKPTTEAKFGEVPTIAADYPLELIENKDQTVQKFFKLNNYSPSQMGTILTPLMGESGHISADENTGTLMVVDTVRSLMRIATIIKQYDVVGAEEVETQIFQIENGNPEDIVALLEKLLSSGAASASSSRSRGPFGRPPSRSSSSRSSSGAATTVTVGTSRTPAVLIPETVYSWIIAKATAEDLKQIGLWIEKLDQAVPTISSEKPLAMMANKNQVIQRVIQRFYRLQSYSSAQMAQVVGQFLTDEGHLSADESTRTLMVMDTVKNLMRIEGIIEEFDVPEAEQTVTATFDIRFGDPAEIVQLLRTLLSADGSGGSSSRSSRYGSSSSRYGSSSSRYGSSYGSSRYGSSYGSSRYGGSSYRPSSYGSSSRSSGSSAVIGTSQVPIVLVPEPTRKWIIARSSAEDMKKIAEWIETLDKEEKIEREYETIPVGYADVAEVADRLNEAIQGMPGSELQHSILIQPLTQARQIMVFGRKDLREMVKKLVLEIDIPSGLFETRVFDLKYADADKIKENLEALYEQEAGYSYGSSYSNRGYRSTSRSVEDSDTVRVIAYATMHQVTVIAGKENMLKIADQIAEWDVALDLEAIKPRILTLRNSDPVQMTDLLKTLFSEESSGSGNNFMRYIFGDDMDEKEKIVGPLYGQLTFEEVPGTKKIVVISNVVGAYEVIEDLVEELDSEEMAEVPELIELKYADPEDLSERLNALFVEAGQQATIRLTDEGLSDESEMDTESESGGGNANNNTTQPATYTPPWSGGGARSGLNTEMPISNVIGRIRFVPEPHTKSIMVLSPPEFMTNIRALINLLDVPGKQVIIEAVIVELEHSKMTSLGVELATDPAAFGTLSENSLLALGNLTTLGTHGSASGIVSPAIGPQDPAGTSGTILQVGTDIYALIDFLIKTTDARILNQQTIWTKDNEEARFFKGQVVAFSAGSTLTGTGASQANIEYRPIGMEVAARPSITPEDSVDLVVGVELSALLADIVNLQPVQDKMKTTTNMIVQDGQTLMLGGILFQ